MNYILLILLSVAHLFSLDFRINQDFGSITIDNISYTKPFLGGFNKPKIQWIDWDFDSDDDLFLLDEDGSIKYYKNMGNLNFQLMDTQMFGISNIGWFYIGNFDNENGYELMVQDSINIDRILFYDIINNQLINMGNIYDINSEYVLSDGVMTPTFVDIDNDNDLDFFTGQMIGTVTFYENLGLNDDMPIFELVSNFWEEIYIVGSSLSRHGASALSFVDIDNDLDYDLTWGDYFQQSLYVITNIGTLSNPDMDNINIINQFPVNDPIVSAGLNMPTFSDIDLDDDMDLFVTVLSGAYGYQLINNFYYYNYHNDTYDFVTNEFLKTIDLFSDIYPTFVDIDNDQDLDLFIGTDVDFNSFPYSGKVNFFENINNNSDPIWELVNPQFLGGNIGNNLALSFGDIDNDNDYDLVVGDFNGYIQLFLNTGTSNNPEFVFHENILNIDLSGYSVPKLFDIDNDSDLDLIVGELNGNISLYRNIGSISEYVYELDDSFFQNFNLTNRAAPSFIDIDEDMDYDLVIGTKTDGLVYYENINNNFSINNTVSFPHLGNNLSPCIYNGNEILVGTSTGGAYFLSVDECTVAGDTNNDLIVDVIDIIYLINIIFDGLNGLISCQNDINNDNVINILDIIELVNIIISE